LRSRLLMISWLLIIQMNHTLLNEFHESVFNFVPYLWKSQTSLEVDIEQAWFVTQVTILPSICFDFLNAVSSWYVLLQVLASWQDSEVCRRQRNWSFRNITTCTICSGLWKRWVCATIRFWRVGHWSYMITRGYRQNCCLKNKGFCRIGIKVVHEFESVGFVPPSFRRRMCNVFLAMGNVGEINCREDKFATP
jgi:hypothetical protein